MSIPNWLEIGTEIAAWLNAQTYESPADPAGLVQAKWVPRYDDQTLCNLQVYVSPTIRTPMYGTRGSIGQFPSGPPATRGTYNTRTEIRSETMVAIVLVQKFAKNDEETGIKNLLWAADELHKFGMQFIGEELRSVRSEWDELINDDVYENHGAVQTSPVLILK